MVVMKVVFKCQVSELPRECSPRFLRREKMGCVIVWLALLACTIEAVPITRETHVKLPGLTTYSTVDEKTKSETDILPFVDKNMLKPAIVTFVADQNNMESNTPEQLMNSRSEKPTWAEPGVPLLANTFPELEKKPDKKELLIAVVSAPTHFTARQAIRDTYQKHARASGRVQVRFFVGLLPQEMPNREEVDNRISSEPDMVRFADFTESYHNLSSKAIDIFHYAHSSGYQSIFKADDDSYVRVDKLLEFWDMHGNDPYVYGGSFVDGKAAMINNPNSKWYMKDQYPYDRLEDYANGPGILLGGRALDFFYREYSRLFRYRVDDAAIAIWLKDLPMEKKQMNVDDYSWTIHPESVWISPTNPQEMQMLFEEKPVNLKVCKDTCLCHGGPKRNTEDCITWDLFSVASYQPDLVPRLALVQTMASVQ